MSWADLESGLAAALLADLGEPVILPGEVTATGLFEPLGAPVAQIGELTGVDARLLQEPQPALYLAPADGDGLMDGDVLMVRGIEYGISRVDADLDGLTRLELTKVR